MASASDLIRTPSQFLATAFFGLCTGRISKFGKVFYLCSCEHHNINTKFLYALGQYGTKPYAQNRWG